MGGSGLSCSVQHASQGAMWRSTALSIVRGIEGAKDHRSCLLHDTFTWCSCMSCDSPMKLLVSG